MVRILSCECNNFFMPGECKSMRVFLSRNFVYFYRIKCPDKSVVLAWTVILNTVLSTYFANQKKTV